MRVDRLGSKVDSTRWIRNGLKGEGSDKMISRFLVGRARWTVVLLTELGIMARGYIWAILL